MPDSTNWPRDALPRGTVFYGYEIVGFLGRGGFGITYRAVDRINQSFALKECFPRQFAVRDGSSVLAADDGYAGEMFAKCLDSFTKEALALTRFSKSGAAGDGVIKVVTSFETNGTAYIVMEFVEGRSLEHLIGTCPDGVPQARLLSILRSIVGTLGCVHDHGLLHRDIKPANLILRQDGRPVLLDFGAARAVRADGPMPSQIFTETYAPIEQIEGRVQGPFSDLYSLGVTCYQAIAGAGNQSAASSSERYRAALRHEPDPLLPAEVLGRGRYSERLLRTIDLLLQVAPEDRPQNVAELMPHIAGDDLLDGGEATRIAGPDDAALGPFDRATAATVFGLAPAAGVQDMTVIAPRPAVAAKTAGGSGVLIAGILVVMVGGIGGGIYWYVHRPAAATSSAAAVSAQPVQPLPVARPTPAVPKPVTDQNEAGAARDDGSALAGLQRAAQAGDAAAQYRLGYIYQLGQGVAVDPEVAMGWYQKAAAQNYAPAQCQIGYLNQYGIGVAQDYAAAARWYGLAAAQGFKTAQLQLGYLSQHGFGMPRNYAAALRWYRLAAGQGVAAAENQLGYLYQKGLGVRMDYREAFGHYKAAADQGLPAAEYSLGLFYAQGLGVPSDPAAARDWIARAAAGGNAEANTWLASH